ncbi:hypothetical protein BCR43DRAFT_565919 [Syncephalastrum racemosum]|uniref:Glutathione S-transferase n=1 Tax=Syncephalastrum racemosum TaxID=13706 RepID=A0A1X2H4K1_SYNRA|nr:hypothetical protein BCR43DRAFT_565919 [Syncephalastrum racemosum]
MAPIHFYDLKLDKDEHWSPNPAKTRFALNVKGIPYDTTFLSFFEIHKQIPEITKTGERPTVPVINDNGKVIQDSWKIAQYLDEKYPEPSLFHGNPGLHQFFLNWSFTNIGRHTFLLLILDLYERLPKDIQPWFRETREQFLGVTLEEAAKDQAGHIANMKTGLESVEAVLADNDYITGPKIGFADIVLMGVLQMLQATRAEVFQKEVLDSFKNINAWWGRVEKYTKDKPPTA